MNGSKQVNKRKVSFVIDVFEPELFVPTELALTGINRIRNGSQGLHLKN